jgi:hypothetical protein
MWAATVAERAEIPAIRLMDLALQNARTVATDLALRGRARRVIGGVAFETQEFEGQVEGISMWFYGFYYSDSSGSYQMIAWTTKNLRDAHRNAAAGFASGFIPKTTR